MDKKAKAIKGLKIVGTIIYLLVTIFLIVMISSVLIDYFNGNEHWKLGGVFLLAITVAASIAYILPIILGGIGSIIASKANDKRSKLYFVFMIFVPIFTAVANFVTYLILLK